jgi:choline dehydrogenase
VGLQQWKLPGWTAKDVLSSFVTEQKDMTARSPEFHGQQGEWIMDEVRYQNTLSKRFLYIGEAMGLGVNYDFNDWSRPQDGVGRFQVSQHNGERVSGATAFLDKARKRTNVCIRSNTMVRRINFDKLSKTARSVTYDLVGDETMKVCSNVLGD